MKSVSSSSGLTCPAPLSVTTRASGIFTAAAWAWAGDHCWTSTSPVKNRVGAVIVGSLNLWKVNNVKVLGQGELTKKFTVHAHGFSKSARERIEAVGGTCQVIED